MSSIHEQAMNYVYHQVLQRLIGHFTRAERTALQLLIQRIVVAAGGMEQVGQYKIMVAHGGGEVSSYTLALLRAAQLSIAVRAPGTMCLNDGLTRARVEPSFRHIVPQNPTFLPDAALNPSAASLRLRQLRRTHLPSERISRPVLYLLIIIPALIIVSSLSSQGLSND